VARDVWFREEIIKLVSCTARALVRAASRGMSEEDLGVKAFAEGVTTLEEAVVGVLEDDRGESRKMGRGRENRW